MLGVNKRMLRAYRLAGLVRPRRAGRAHYYTESDIAALRALRAGLNAKRAAHMLGVSLSQLARYRDAGRLHPKAISGTKAIRYVYDPAELASFRG